MNKYYLSLLLTLAFCVQSCQSIEEKKVRLSKLQENLRVVNQSKGYIALPSLISLENIIEEIADLSLELAEYHEARIGLVPNAKAQAVQEYQLALDLYNATQSNSQYHVIEEKQSFTNDQAWMKRYWRQKYSSIPISLAFIGVSEVVTIAALVRDQFNLEDKNRYASRLPDIIGSKASDGISRIKDLPETDFEALNKRGHSPNLEISISQTIPVTDENRDLIKVVDGKNFNQLAKTKPVLNCDECLEVPSILSFTKMESAWSGLFIDVLAQEDGDRIPYFWRQQVKINLIDMPNLKEQEKQARVEIVATAFIPNDNLMDFVAEQVREHANREYKLELKILEEK